MTYTILSAQWGNAEQSSAVIRTQEVGHVAISERDTPEEWAAFQTWKASNVVSSPPAPLAPPANEMALMRERIDELERKTASMP